MNGGRATSQEGAAAGASGDDDALAGYSTLLWAVLYKRFVLLVRYPVDTGAQVVSIYLFFAVIFYGGQAAAGSVGGAAALGSTLDALIVGWFLWTMSIAAYMSLSMNVTEEAQWGTLEQLFMSPYGFGTVVGAMVVANLLWSLLWGAVMLALMLLTTPRSLSVDLLTVLPLSVLALLSVVGLGFVFAGLALLYKRVQNVTQLMQFALIGFIAAPVTGFSPLRFLPLVQGSDMLQEAMRQGTHLWQFPLADLAILLVTAVGYSLAGYVVFMRAARRARRKGVLGHY